MSFSYPQATPVKIAKKAFQTVFFSVGRTQESFLAVIKYFGSNPLQPRVFKIVHSLE